MEAHQAPPSLGFSRQEHWSGLPFPSPMHESESKVTQLCPTLSDPMDCSLLGSSIHGIFPARVLEWDAIAFSNSSYIYWCYFNLSHLPNCFLSPTFCHFALNLIRGLAEWYWGNSVIVYKVFLLCVIYINVRKFRFSVCSWISSEKCMFI